MAQNEEAAPSASSPEVTTVYKNDITEIVETSVWSKSKTDRTPDGTRTFLGQHTSREQLMMRLEDLPPHQYLRLKCRVLAFKSWDGNHEQWGQDTFTVLVNRGPLLLHTSFCNPGNLVVEGPDAPKTGHVQSFPDEHPLGNHPAATGADEVVKLGYQVRPGFQPPAAIYHLDMVFPHTEEEIGISFMANLQYGAGDESWGIAGIEVEALSGPVEKSEEELDALWIALSGDDPAKAHRAVWQTIEGGPNAVESIAARWQAWNGDGKKPQPAEGDPDLDRALVTSRVSHISRVANWNPHHYQIRSSYHQWHNRSFLGAVHDQAWPRASANKLLPHFSLGKGQEEPEWIEYRFAEARTISGAEVFWHHAKPEGAPRSWRILYESDGGDWLPVKAEEEVYTTKADGFNQAAFEPVTTRAIRLSVLPSQSMATGVFEFRLQEAGAE